MMMRSLDSHLHLWDPSRFDYGWLPPELDRAFAPSDLRASAVAPLVDTRRHIFVQAECAPHQYLREAIWAAQLSPQIGIVGIVAGAALEQGTRVRRHLDQLRNLELVVGVRRVLHTERVGFAESADFVSGVREVAMAGLTFDACVRPNQIGEVSVLAAMNPEMTVVLDHLGNPPVDKRSDVDADWLTQLRELEQRPNAFVKLSGLPALAGEGWSSGQLRPSLEAVLDTFGVTRVMFGSDWPVSHPYDRWIDLVRDVVTGAGLGEHLDAVFWTNAVRAYGLGAIDLSTIGSRTVAA